MFSIACIVVLSLGYLHIYFLYGKIAIINKIYIYLSDIDIINMFCGNKEKRNCTSSCQYGGYLPTDKIGQNNIGFGTFNFKIILNSILIKYLFRFLKILNNIFFRLVFANLVRKFFFRNYLQKNCKIIKNVSLLNLNIHKKQ